MIALQEMVLNALQDSGYDLITAMETWTDFKSELKTYPKGYNRIVVGKYEISFYIEGGL